MSVRSWVKWMQDEQHCEKALEEIQSYNFEGQLVGMKLVGSLFQELLNCFESSSKTRKTILAALKYLLPLSTDKIKITNALSKFICEHPKNLKLCLELIPLGNLVNNSKDQAIKHYVNLINNCIYVLIVEKCVDPELFATVHNNHVFFARSAMEQNSKDWLEEFSRNVGTNLSRLLCIQPAETVQKYLQETLIEHCKSSEALDGESSFNEYLSWLNIIIFLKRNQKTSLELQQLNEIYEQHKWFPSIHADARKAVQLFVTFLCSTNTDDAEDLLTALHKVYKIYKTTKAKDSMNAATIFITKHLPTAIRAMEITQSFALTYIHLMTQILNVVRRIQQDLQLCSKCNSTKRHLSIDVMRSVFDILRPLIKSNADITSISKNSLDTINYLISVINDLKCSMKHPLLNSVCVTIYNLLVIFKEKPQIMANREFIEKLLKILFQHSDHENNSIGMLKIVKLVTFLYGNMEPDESLKGDCFVILYYLRESSKEDSLNNKELISSIARARNKLMLSKYNGKSLTELICSNELEILNNEPAAGFNKIDLVLAEMEYLIKYSSKHSEEVWTLMKDLQELTTDALVLGKALQLLHNISYPLLDRKLVEDIERKLEIILADLDDGDVEKATCYTTLGIISYYYYLMEFEKTKREIKEKSSTLEEKNKLSMLSVGTLGQETKTVSYLNTALKHFSDMLTHFYQANDGEITGLPSVRRVIKMIEIIGQQMLLRNIKSKAVEAFVVLYGLSKLRDDNLGLVTVATFFLDHHELLAKQVFQLSQCFSTPSVEELIVAANEKIEEYLKTFETIDVNTQSYVISYLLSLTSYYAKTGDLGSTAKTLGQVSKIMDSWETFTKTEEKSGYKIILNAKRYSCYVDIITNNPSLVNMNAQVFLTFAAQELCSYKNVATDFATQIQIIFGSIALQIITFNISCCADSDRLTGTLRSWKTMAIRSGYIIKLVEISIFSIFRNLQNQDMEKSKLELLELNQILGIEEEMLVCIESPVLKTAPVVATLDWQNPELEVSVRKMKVKESPVAYELIHDNTVEHSKSAVEKLTKYMHPLKCKCQCCKYPHLKFQLFQISCLYARILFLNEKYETNNEFNEVAFKHWDENIQKKFLSNNLHLPISFQASKREFVLFSICWLMQIYDVCLKLKNYQRCKEMCVLAADICLKFQPANYAMQQNIFVRLENLKCIDDYERIENKKSVEFADYEKNLEYSKFQKQQDKKKPAVKPSAAKVKVTTSSLAPPKIIAKASSTRVLSKSAIPTASSSSTRIKTAPQLGPLAASKRVAKTSSKLSTLTDNSTALQSTILVKVKPKMTKNFVYVSSDSDSDISVARANKNATKKKSPTDEKKTKPKGAPKSTREK